MKFWLDCPSFLEIINRNLISIRKFHIFTVLKKQFYISLLLIVLSSVAFSQSKIATDNYSTTKMVRFYPSPASTIINFDMQHLNANNRMSLLIFNFMGKKVYELKNMPSKVNIALDDFYRGIYIYQLRDKNGVPIETGKFQVLK